MKKKKISTLVSNIGKLSETQYRELKEQIKPFDKKKEVANLLEEKFDVKCGHCDSINFIKHGVRQNLQRYKCKDCGKTFNILTATPLARLRKKGRWLNYAACMSLGLTLKLTSEIVGVNITTSFRWRHTFLENANILKPQKLQGIVEGIDTVFKYSEKGKHNPSNDSYEAVGASARKVYVLAVRDRHRFTFDDIIFDKDISRVSDNQLEAMPQDVLFCSLNESFYDKISKKLEVTHAKVSSSKTLLRKDRIVHLKNAENYKNDLHDWMKRFCGVATKYLSNYLSWYRELDEYLMEIPPEVILYRARSLDKNPYQPLTQK